MKHLKEYSQRQQDSQDEPVEEFESPLAEGGNREQENTAEQEKRIQTHSAELMEALIQSAGEDIDTKIADIICQITKKVGHSETDYRVYLSISYFIPLSTVPFLR